MPDLPDFKNLRYLNEVGWFLYRDTYGYNHFTSSYAGERMVWSQMLLKTLTADYGKSPAWIEDKTILNIGCGCTGEMAAWPAPLKIAVDPLLYTYQQLGMLLQDAPGTSRTLYLSVGVEALPLLNESVDVVICRNALDHMADPKLGLGQLWRVLKKDGVFFLSVDIGGEPTPDEPSPFTEDFLKTLLGPMFRVVREQREPRAHNEHRSYRVKIIAHKLGESHVSLDRHAILRAYELAVGAVPEPLSDIDAA